MKIFVSYSRNDARDFAEKVQEHLSHFNEDVFTDISSIQGGDIWNKAIRNFISSSDIFVIIVTNGALRSQEVENEVLQAENENKIIIPCIHRDVNYKDIKWNLTNRQGIKFGDKYELVRDLHARIITIPQQGKEVTRTEALASQVIDKSKEMNSEDKTTDEKHIIPPMSTTNLRSIFISYSRDDAKDIIRDIRNDFRKKKYEVFIDTDMLKGIKWKKEIDENINNCDIFLAVFTQSALYESSYMKTELDIARRYNKKIVPCIHEDIIEEPEISIYDILDENYVIFNTSGDLLRALFKTLK